MQKFIAVEAFSCEWTISFYVNCYMQMIQF